MNIEEFAEQVIHGTGGFKSWEDHEVVSFTDRDVAVAKFVIKCIANIECEGSEETFKAIEEKRVKELKATRVLALIRSL